MLRKTIIKGLGLFLFGHLSVAGAQWTGVVNLTPLAQVIEQAQDDKWVKTRGYLVQRLSDDTYLLQMGAAKLQVEIDQYVFPLQPFNESTLIEIEGEMDIDWPSNIELEAKKITLVDE